MQVALNAWFWDRPDTGSGQYTRRLVEHLETAAPEVTVARLRPEGRHSSWIKLWFEQVGFPRACVRRGVDVAHVPYWGPPLATRVPTVVTVHDLIPLLLRPYRGGPLVRAYTALVATGAENAALILTDSRASRRDILTHLRVPPQRVRAIPLAAGARYRPEPGPDDAAVRTRYELPERYYLYLGGFDVRKNVVVALRTSRWIGPALGDDCPLVVAGRLPAEDTAFAPDPRRQARELELEAGWVRFIGQVAEAEKPALYRGAVAFVFPSRYEGFGLPPLEAMACGTPVVGSDTASLPEVVGDAGVLLSPDDAEGMAGALIQLAQDADFRAELGQRALAQAATFSWERTARETVTAYRQVVGSFS
ncbi:MAG: glycosyltransferase family 1 protein [Anaerolineae bacterium]|jgi:glycosyltransferase involved in cell wall biosynthesis